ncbi:hypothetical protein CRUP_031251, partial [Coryphaenoides rupestris]
HTDMAEEMRVETMELCVTACEKFATNNEVRMIGEGFGFEVTHEVKNLLYMFFGGSLAHTDMAEEMRVETMELCVTGTLRRLVCHITNGGWTESVSPSEGKEEERAREWGTLTVSVSVTSTARVAAVGTGLGCPALSVTEDML